VLFAISGRPADRSHHATPGSARRGRGHSLGCDGVRFLLRSCCRRCNACMRCRSAPPISVRSASSRAPYRPNSARPPQGLSRGGTRPGDGGLDGAWQAVLYTRWGGLAYGAMALLAAAGGVCALAARRLGIQRRLKSQMGLGPPRRPSAPKIIAGLVHRGELAAAQKHHVRREAAAGVRSSCAPCSGIDVHQKAWWPPGSAPGGPSSPGCHARVKSEPRPRCHADTLAPGSPPAPWCTPTGRGRR